VETFSKNMPTAQRQPLKRFFKLNQRKIYKSLKDPVE